MDVATMTGREGPDPPAAPAPAEPGAGPAPEGPSAGGKRGPGPVPGRSRSSRLLLLFLLVSQPLLLVVVLFPVWWAALPVLSLWGILGWKRAWFWAPLAGFALGFGFWGVQLAFLPAGPRDRLAGIIGSGFGASATVGLLVGPLLFGVMAALSALALAGGLRVWSDMHPAGGATGTEGASDPVAPAA